MTNHIKKSLVILLLLLAVTASLAESAGRRYNLFDPIFADEESDTHTVSAGPQNRRETQEFGRRQNVSSRFAPQDNYLPPRVDDFQTRRPSAAPTPSVPKATPAFLINKLQSTSTEPKRSSNSKRQIVVSSTNVRPEDLSTTSARRLQTTEAPKHWSALENYYAKLRQSVVAKQLNEKPLTLDESTAYNQLVQDSVSEQLLNSHRYQPIYQGDPNGSGNKQQAATRPVILSSVPQSQPFLLPLADSNYRQAPYISSDPNSGIGSGSVLMLPQVNTQLQQQQQPVRSHNTFEYSKTLSRQPVIIQQQPELIDTRPLQRPQRPQAAHPSSWPSSNNMDLAAVRSYELRKLPELLFIQQQQNRAKHQQETFGSWYDEQKVREQLQEETYCGPRNQVYSQAAPGEYPSHMGLYNGSKMNEDDFVCAATWVHERFALTLASCIKNVSSTNMFLRTGEWNVNRNWANSSQSGDQLRKATMISRQVSRVHLFPRYQTNSSEHNLALLEWAKPVDFLEAPYVVPACQMQPRSSLRANNCWAPVRNVTLSEYFDADGEGETKLKKNVKMAEVNVKLVASDDVECLRQTFVEFFNFQHPNYICSADFRRHPWRAKLNQTDYFGSGIYCEENGSLNLVSVLHPMLVNSSSTFGFMDLSYYRPWMRNIILGRSF